MFRELAPAEIDLVSGGYDAGEIVVTAPGGMDLWGFTAESGFTPDDYGSGIFTEGGEGSSGCSAFLAGSAAAAAAEIGAWIRWIIDKVLEAGRDQARNESAVANSFDPDDVIQNFWENGHHVWIMENGNRYVDTNGNGMPDIFYKYGSDGIIWGNQGTGWFDTGGRWVNIPISG